MKKVTPGLLSFATLLASCTPLHTLSTDANACTYAKSNERCIGAELADPLADFTSKKFELPAQNNARLYVVRSYASVRYQATHLQLDHRPVANLSPYTFAELDVTPGWHAITIDADHDVDLHLNLAPGKVYFVSAELMLLFNTTSGKLRVLDSDDGQSTVLRSRKVISLAAPQ